MALTDNLVAYWKFDESSGNAIEEVSAFTTTNNGSVTYGAAKLSNGADFASNGNTQFFKLTETASWNFGSGVFSIAFWFKNASGTSTRVVMCNDDNWLAAGGWGVVLQNNKLSFATNAGTVLGTTDSADGTWRFCAIVREGTGAGQTNLYFDGNATPDASGTDATNFSNPDGLWIGGGNLGIQTGMNGMLDEVGIWKGKALSAAEVGEIYNGGAGLTYPFAAGRFMTLKKGSW